MMEKQLKARKAMVPPSGSDDYSPYQEVVVPGSKVGVVIEEAGETKTKVLILVFFTNKRAI